LQDKKSLNIHVTQKLDQHYNSSNSNKKEKVLYSIQQLQPIDLCVEKKMRDYYELLTKKNVIAI